VNYKVESTANFSKELKNLAKKYRSLPKDVEALVSQLEQTPEIGTPIGHHCYKIRLAIKSKGLGKSGGARVITHIYLTQKSVYLLSIYDKSKQASISDDEVLRLVAGIS
jgi:mRNA-degrading endonuclease RelE of RelBE toxin-antitoxin system